MSGIGLSLPPFSIRACKDGYIIACKGYHLTLLFDEERISVHLTQHDREDKLGRAEVSLRRLEIFSNYVTNLLFSRIRKARLKDLFEKGYRLTYDGENIMEAAFKKHSPTRKRKIRPNLAGIIDEMAKPGNVEKLFYKPSILCSPGLKRDVALTAKAAFRKGRPKRPDLGIFYFSLQGHEGWYTFSADDLSTPMLRDVMPRLVKDFGDFGRLVAERMDLENSLTELMAGLKIKL